MKILFFIVSLIFVAYVFGVEHLHDTEDVESFFMKNGNNISAIFLYKSHETIKYFDNIDLFDKYGIPRAVFDCHGMGKTISACDKTEGNEVIAVFKNGEFLFNLDIFVDDYLSLESQILLASHETEVPVHTNLNERIDMMTSQYLPQIFIYGYSEKLYTKAHSYLVKLAHKYTGLYKFGFATNLSACQNLHQSDSLKENDTALWIINCEKNEQDCVSYQYGIHGFSDTAFEKILEKFGENNLMVIDGHSTTSQIDLFKENQLHSAIVCYETNTSEKMVTLISRISHAFKGILGFILIDVLKANAFSSLCENPDIKGKIQLSLNGADHLMVTDIFKNDIQFVEEVNSKIYEFHKEEESQEDEVLVQDDGIALIAEKVSNDVLKNFSLVLTDKTHDEFLKQTTYNRMILYYVPFDPVSKIFLTSYENAAKELLRDNLDILALINCFDYTYVCKKQNIITYPTIFILADDGSRMSYNKSLSSDSIVSTMKLINSKFPLYLETISEVINFIQGNLPYQNMHFVSNHTVLAVFKNANDVVLSNFKNQVNLEIPAGFAIGLNSDVLGMTIPEENYLIFYHRSMDTVATKVVSLKETSDINAIISHYTETHLVQLSALNFHEKFALNKPFVILFDTNISPTSFVYLLMESLSQEDVTNQYIFSYMDITNPDGIERRIFLEYETEENVPALIYVNHSDKEIHIFPHDVDKNRENVEQWLVDIKINKPTHHLKDYEWRPQTSGYNFMKILYPEQFVEENTTEFDVSTSSYAHDSNSPSAVDTTFSFSEEKVEL